MNYSGEIPISKGLDALERIKLVYESTDIPVIEKELKALEIFATKQIDILCLRISNSANEYNRTIKLFGSNLTQEEYDLLKEVLL